MKRRGDFYLNIILMCLSILLLFSTIYPIINNAIYTQNNSISLTSISGGVFWYTMSIFRIVLCLFSCFLITKALLRKVILTNAGQIC